MTVNYNGGDIYQIWFQSSNREMIFGKSEVDEIKEWDFESNKEHKSREELLEQIANLEYLIYEVKYAIKNDEVESLDDIVKMLEN